MSNPTTRRRLTERERVARWLQEQGRARRMEGEKTFEEGGNGADSLEAAHTCFDLRDLVLRTGLRRSSSDT